MNLLAQPGAVDLRAAVVRPHDGKNIAIQQLRAVAILMVLAQHLSLTHTANQSLGMPVTIPFYVGVELFFIVSGFVVTQTLQANAWSVGYFLSRRFFRLYPPIAVFLTLSLGVVAFANSFPDAHFARGLFGSPPGRFRAEALQILTGTFLPGIGPSLYVNGAMWSLSVEFQFYIAVAVVLSVCRFCGSTGARTRHVLACLTVVLLPVFLAVRLGILADIRIPFVGILLAWKLDYMVWGVAIALFLPRDAVPAALARRSILILMFVALAVLAVNRSPLVASGPTDWLEGLGFALVLPLLSGAVALAVFVPDGLVRPNTWLAGLLTWVGDRSYTIYLMHYPLLAIVWFGIFKWATPIASMPWRYGLTQAAISLPIIFGFSELVFRVVEVPAIRFGRRLIGMRRARAISATQPQ